MTTAAILLAITPLMLVSAFFSIEVALGLAPMTDRRGCTVSSPSAVIVIPAHDEAGIISGTLRQLKSALSDTMRILVIADNCSDVTAERARREGVRVIERSNAERRGKGYALAFAVEQLECSPPNVMVVLDADCWIDRESLCALVNAADECGRPCQAVDLLCPDRTAPPLVQISAFAFMLRNLVRQRGLQRLAGRVHLMGTGMAIPYRLLTSSLLATGDIVEDLSLGLDMSERGYPPQLVSDAVVLSGSATATGTLTQRRRWEGGFLATSFRRAPRQMFRAIRLGDLRLLFSALDLMVPPLALLAFVNVCAVGAVAALVALLGLSYTLVAVAALLILIPAALVFAVWATHGRSFVSLTVLARIPFYVAWKLPLYLSLARRGAPREWLRTRR